MRVILRMFSLPKRFNSLLFLLIICLGVSACSLGVEIIHLYYAIYMLDIFSVYALGMNYYQLVEQRLFVIAFALVIY